MAKDDKNTKDVNPINNLGRDEGSPQDAKTAFEQNTNAKVCYVNAQGEWLFANPDKSFGAVTKTYNRDEDGKITERNGFIKHEDHVTQDTSKLLLKK